LGAALVVGIILVYLSRTGLAHLARFAWYGVAAATALSLAVAMALQRWQISEDGFEACCCWSPPSSWYDDRLMNRVARHLKKDIEQEVESYAVRRGPRRGSGDFSLCVLMSCGRRRVGADFTRRGDVHGSLQTGRDHLALPRSGCGCVFL